MAYHEFHDTPKYEAVLPNWGESVARVAEIVSARKLAQEQQEQQYQNHFSPGEEGGYFPAITNEVHNDIKDIVKSNWAHHMAGGKGLHRDTAMKMAEVAGKRVKGEALGKEYTNLEQEIQRKKTEDPKYIAGPDEDTLRSIYNLKSSEEIENGLKNFHPGSDIRNTFDVSKGVASWVATQGKKATANDTTSQSGVKTSSSNEGKFFDKNKVPNITEEHVNNLLESDPRYEEFYLEKAHDQMHKELDQAIAAGETWQHPDVNGGKSFKLKDRDKNELWVDYLQHPEINPNAPKTIARDQNGQVISDENGNPKQTIQNIGNRVYNMAKSDIAQHEDTSNKFTFDAGNYDAKKARGITSKKYNVVNTFDPNSYGGAGGVLVNEEKGTNGISIPVRGKVFDKTNKTLVGGTGDMEMFATNYNYLPVKADGTPIDWQHKSIEDQITAIQNMPLSEIRNLDLKTVVHGQAYNKLDLNKSRAKLESNKANPNATKEEQEQDEKRRSILMAAGMDPDLSPELLQKSLGIPVSDVIKVVDNPTASQIEGKLGEFNILNRKNETAEQKQVRMAWDKRKAEADKDYNRQTTELQSGDKKRVGKVKGEILEQNIDQIARNQPLKEKYSLKGVPYTLEELNKMGYSDEQIKKAHLQGIIK